jgi:hypothetical protein
MKLLITHFSQPLVHYFLGENVFQSISFSDTLMQSSIRMSKEYNEVVKFSQAEYRLK